MKKLICLLLLSLTITACNKTDQVELKKNQEVNPSKIESDVPQFFSISVIKNMNWIESPLFTYEGIELRGEKGKLGILSTPWKAGKKNKYMWHFFGKEVPSDTLTVVAVQKGTNQVSKALVVEDSDKLSWSTYSVPSTNEEHTEVPAAMKLPSKGMWVLNAYIGKKLFGQVVVNVE
jgi:hypothetical protein